MSTGPTKKEHAAPGGGRVAGSTLVEGMCISKREDAGAMRKLAYTLEEVLELGFEARHMAADGCCWLFHGCFALCADPATGRRTLITNPNDLPDGPWHPTEWGEAELAK
jgi:hypothetical protein